MFADTVCDISNLFSENETQPSSYMIKYEEGYASGLNWLDAWEGPGKPGGPWVHTSGPCFNCRTPRNGCDRQTSPRWTCRQELEYSRRSSEENRLWRKGWEDGHKEKISTGRKNIS